MRLLLTLLFARLNQPSSLPHSLPWCFFPGTSLLHPFQFVSSHPEMGSVKRGHSNPGVVSPSLRRLVIPLVLLPLLLPMQPSVQFALFMMRAQCCLTSNRVSTITHSFFSAAFLAHKFLVCTH